MRTSSLSLLVAVLSGLLGCEDPGPAMMNPDPGGGGTTPGGGGTTPGGGGTTPSTGVVMVTVAGSVVDFQTSVALTGSAAVSVNGVSPIPSATMTGADFLLENVQPFSVFYVIASSPPEYRSTYNPALRVDGLDVTGVSAAAVKESYLTSLATAFKVGPSAGNAILIAQATDANGMPAAGVPAGAFKLTAPAAAKGPFFLDAMKQPAPALTSTSASGYVVFFDMPAGPVAFEPAASGFSISGPAAPVVGSMVTLSVLSVVATTAVPPPPTTKVSFATQVMPIFMRRGCVNCHSGNGPGRDLGSLTLDASVVQSYRNLTQVISPNFKTTRVNLTAPEKSLVLTMPSYSNPPNGHPTVVYTSNTDADYLMILNWIKQGALDN